MNSGLLDEETSVSVGLNWLLFSFRFPDCETNTCISFNTIVIALKLRPWYEVCAITTLPICKAWSLSFAEYCCAYFTHIYTRKIYRTVLLHNQPWLCIKSSIITSKFGTNKNVIALIIICIKQLTSHFIWIIKYSGFTLKCNRYYIYLCNQATEQSCPVI